MPAVGEAFQAEPPPIGEVELWARAGQLAGDLGDENLATLGPCRDASRSIDRLAVEIVTFRHHLARVDPDAHPQLLPRKAPVALVQALLDGDGTGERPPRRGESDEKSIPQRLDLSAPVIGDTAANEFLVGAVERGRQRRRAACGGLSSLRRRYTGS